MRPSRAVRRSAAAFLVAATLGAGCHAARTLAPPPPLRAASASAFAVDVEFDASLDRSSAEDVAHFELWPAASPGTTVPLGSAVLIDTTLGRVVQLLVSGGPLSDTTDYVVTAHGVLDLQGRSTGDRTIAFRSGLSYRAPMQAWFDERCSTCHGASRQGGTYRTDSYAGLFGNGSDGTPNLIAGDPNCLLVRRCRPERSMWDAGRLSYLDYEMLLNWVSSYGARF